MIQRREAVRLAFLLHLLELMIFEMRILDGATPMGTMLTPNSWLSTSPKMSLNSPKK
jgi:hypothetical protein